MSDECKERGDQLVRYDNLQRGEDLILAGNIPDHLVVAQQGGVPGRKILMSLFLLDQFLRLLGTYMTGFSP